MSKLKLVFATNNKNKLKEVQAMLTNFEIVSLAAINCFDDIAETADTFFGIIRTEDMKLQNLYRFKLLKQRDGDFLKSQVKIDLNTTYLTLENDRFIDS